MFAHIVAVWLSIPLETDFVPLCYLIAVPVLVPYGRDRRGSRDGGEPIRVPILRTVLVQYRGSHSITKCYQHSSLGAKFYFGEHVSD